MIKYLITGIVFLVIACLLASFHLVIFSGICVLIGIPLIIQPVLDEFKEDNTNGKS